MEVKNLSIFWKVICKNKQRGYVGKWCMFWISLDPQYKSEGSYMLTCNLPGVSVRHNIESIAECMGKAIQFFEEWKKGLDD